MNGMNLVMETKLQLDTAVITEFRPGHESSDVVANFPEFSEQDKLKAFNKKRLHSCDKNEHEIHNTPNYQSIVHRPSVILLDDVEMNGGMKNPKHILKTAFVNHHASTKLDIDKDVDVILICELHCSKQSRSMLSNTLGVEENKQRGQFSVQTKQR